ncbi:unnamed protein product [Trichobilharzia regenti]|nr:unnamed protein product [Trichobilharzia regenti]
MVSIVVAVVVVILGLLHLCSLRQTLTGVSFF